MSSCYPPDETDPVCSRCGAYEIDCECELQPGERHRHGWRTCDGKGFVRVVGCDGEYAWDVCCECIADRNARARAALDE